MVAPRPFDLEPQTAGQLLLRSLLLYRRHILTFAGILAVVQIPIAVLQLGVGLVSPPAPAAGATETQVAQDALVFLCGSLITSLMVAILNQLGLGALSRAIGLSIMGRAPAIREAYQQISSSWLTLVGILFLGIMYALALSLAGLITCSLFGLLLFLGFAVQMAVPIVVLENQTAGDALLRAWILMRRRLWWVLGYMLLLTLFQFLVVAVPVLIGLLFPDPGTQAAGQMLALGVPAVIALALNVAWLPLQYIAIVLMYLDLRLRHEGLDQTLSRARIFTPGRPRIQLLAQVPRPQGVRLITGTEYAALVAITVVFFSLTLAAGAMVGGAAALLDLLGGFP